MTANPDIPEIGQNIDHWPERVDLAASFRWAERLNMHEAVANHFSLSVNDNGSQFLMNPNQVHFRRIRASDLLLLDANDPDTLSKPGAPDPTAWGLHGSIHRACPHARCVMHVHSIFATVLASLADSTMPPIDQNTAMFFNRMIVDEEFGGLAFDSEGARCATMLSDPKQNGDGQSRGAGDRRFCGRHLQPALLFRARRRNLYPRPANRPALAGDVR